jgi:hypothetical protein
LVKATAAAAWLVAGRMDARYRAAARWAGAADRMHRRGMPARARRGRSRFERVAAGGASRGHIGAHGS